MTISVRESGMPMTVSRNSPSKTVLDHGTEQQSGPASEEESGAHHEQSDARAERMPHVPVRPQEPPYGLPVTGSQKGSWALWSTHSVALATLTAPMMITGTNRAAAGMARAAAPLWDRSPPYRMANTATRSPWRRSHQATWILTATAWATRTSPHCSRSSSSHTKSHGSSTVNGRQLVARPLWH